MRQRLRTPFRFAAVVAALVCVSCTSIRLASQDPYPAGQAVAGPDGGYALTPPSEHWVRAEWNETAETIDWALAHQEGDAWLNVSVLRGRFATAELALARARAEVDALMLTVSRNERDVVVPSPAGELPARLGVYCGSFDRELRSRDNCFVLLAAQQAEVSYALVGQVRVRDPEPGRQDELERLVLSLQLIAPSTEEVELD